MVKIDPCKLLVLLLWWLWGFMPSPGQNISVHKTAHNLRKQIFMKFAAHIHAAEGMNLCELNDPLSSNTTFTIIFSPAPDKAVTPCLHWLHSESKTTAAFAVLCQCQLFTHNTATLHHLHSAHSQMHNHCGYTRLLWSVEEKRWGVKIRVKCQWICFQCRQLHCFMCVCTARHAWDSGLTRVWCDNVSQ